MHMKAEDLFDLSHTLAAPLLASVAYPHEAVPMIKDMILALQDELGDEFVRISEGILAARSARIAESAVIEPPAIIGRETEIRHCAFLRGSVLIGDGAVIGNSTEIKNSVIFDGVQLPHYNYVGDSILGCGSHLGAGAIASNFRLDKKSITAFYENEKISTGMRKLGVMLGDRAEIGASSVLCPGAVIGRGSIIYPLSCVRGYVGEGAIFKNGGADERK